MATRFKVFRKEVAESDALIQQANEEMVAIEDAGGKFVDSHWAVAGPNSGGSLVATLVVVYEAGTSAEEVAEGNAALDAYYRNEGLSSTGESQE